MTGLACATCVAVRFQKQLSNCPTTKHPGSPKPRQHVVLVGLPSPKMLPSSLGDQAKLPKCNAPQSGEITGDLQVRSNELLLRSKSFSETFPENEKVNKTLERVAKPVLRRSPHTEEAALV